MAAVRNKLADTDVRRAGCPSPTLLSIYDKYPRNIFAAKSPRGIWSAVPPLLVLSRTIWHQNSQAGGGLLAY